MNDSLLKTDKIGRLRYTSEQKKTMEIFLPGGARLSITSANHVAFAVALIRQLQNTRSC